MKRGKSPGAGARSVMRAMTEAGAAEQQAATAHILRALARSSTDPQPVFEAIVEHAHRLTGALYSVLYRYDGEKISIAADRHVSRAASRAQRASYPRSPSRDYMVGRTILEGRTMHSPDLPNDPRFPGSRHAVSRYMSRRALVTVPLLRDGVVIGAIGTGRAEAKAFTKKEIKLLETFADQAVIAIEKVRLFNETKEALEHQKASADVLRIVAASVENADPVFDAITQAGMRLVPGSRVGLLVLRDGQLHHASHSGIPNEQLAELAKHFPAPLDRKTIAGASILDRRVIQVADIAGMGDRFPRSLQAARTSGDRSLLVVPLLHGADALGSLSIRRAEPGAFTDKQIALAKTFADQAVIAIRNARMFNETKEALERQTATSEVLQVISSSPMDLNPVYETILANVTRLCEANFAALFLYDGQFLTGVAHHNATRQLAEAISRGGIRPSRETTTRLAALERRVVHVEDILNDPAFSPPEATRREGTRTALSVPLLRKGVLVGVITMWRREPRRFTDAQVALVKTFADQAVIAIENVRLFNETKEALEQQTAISEVLRVISDSPTDVKPVLEAVAVRAARICEASDARIWLVEGDSIRHVAGFGDVPMPVDLDKSLPLDRGTVSGRAILDCAPVHVEDMAKLTHEDYPISRKMQERSGFRTILSVPLMREQHALGAIMVRRLEVRSFSDKQIALLKTFADQAAIAIENVRLFNETKEALDRQTATAEILRVISSTPTDTQPVFEAIVQSGHRVFADGGVGIAIVEGHRVRVVSAAGQLGPMATKVDMPLNRESATGAAIVGRTLVNIRDTETAAAPRFARDNGRALGFRAIAAAPMLLREGQAVGAIGVTLKDPGGLSDKQLELLKTFADQAVIAIENVRLFNELQSRNRALTEALEQQTATGEILKTISSSTSDVQPVFETIIRNAVRLCDGAYGGLFRCDGDMVDIVADYNFAPEAKAEYQRAFPQPLSAENPMCRAILERTAVNMADVLESGYPDEVKRRVTALGARAGLAVPMMRGDTPIGAITVTRREPGAFSESYVELLKTFAAQAVIAIENVRLFNEINEALRLQTSTAEVLKTISRSTFDLDRVLRALLDNAARLSGAERAAMLRPGAEGNFVPTVTFNYPLDSPLIARMRERPIRPGRDSINGRVLLEKRPIHVPDVLADPEYGRQDLVGVGHFRTVLSVPMLRNGEAIGLIALIKGKEVDPFTDKQMEVVTTFADQAVIAIENVRLFKEIEEKSAQLEIANKHKSDFLANMSHELRTPLNAIIGFSEALMERMFGELNEKQADYLRDIHESGKHLLSLINDILDLSKIEAGRMELELSSFHLPTALSNAMTLIRERAQRHSITLNLDVDERLGEMAADERKFKQIMLNLLSNAVKFTPDGGKVDVSAKKFDGKIEVAVRDSGIGIAPEDQAAVFEEFKQVGRDQTSKAEGTGLGLALTKRFVELHGGVIRLESTPGKGSTFAFTLPLRA